MSEKRAYTPAEFAALFGRTKTWTYRLHYAGKIKCITDYGKLMVPASEAARIEADTASYKSGKIIPKIPQADDLQALKIPPKGSELWSAWVKNRAAGGKRGKSRAGKAAFLGRSRDKAPGVDLTGRGDLDA